MTEGTSQGLFIVVAIVIFGIFVVMAYILFEDTLSPSLANMFTTATETASERIDKGIVTFKDANLEKAIREQLVTQGVLEVDAQITTENMLKLETFNFDGRHLTPAERVRSINGLQHAKNLKVLYLGHHRIEDISYLKDLTQLESLVLGQSQLKNTDLRHLRKLTNLSVLNVGTCNLTDVSELRHLTNLKNLRIDANPLTDISFISDLTNLKELYIYSTNVKDISTLLNHPSLTNVQVRNTKISQEDLTKLLERFPHALI